MKKNHIKSVNTFLIYIVLIFWAVTTIYPIFWVISNSFKDKKMIMSDAFSLPLGKLFTTANYTDAFSKMNILNAYKISILTGFRDFDYCQEAIRLGVCRFLLKPSKLEEIEEALAVMAENLKKKGVASHEESQEENSAGSFIVKNALAYMEEHYNEKLTLALVAEKTYVSQWHLSKLLNKHENRNFSEILNQIRVEHAKELLKEMQLRIVDISEMVGFTDVAHFSRVFKKMEGISANEYRNTRL